MRTLRLPVYRRNDIVRSYSIRKPPASIGQATASSKSVAWSLWPPADRNNYQQYQPTARSTRRRSGARHHQRFLPTSRASPRRARFLEYVRDAEIIIHNAPFDTGFISHELGRLGEAHGRLEDYCRVIDTLQMARSLHRPEERPRCPVQALPDRQLAPHLRRFARQRSGRRVSGHDRRRTTLLLDGVGRPSRE